MAESTEFDLLLEDAHAFAHDLIKYSEDAAWDWKFMRFKALKDRDFASARKLFYSLADDVLTIRDLAGSRDFSSRRFKNAARRIEKKTFAFLEIFGRFAKSKECPKELRAFFRNYSTPFRMAIPLARFLADGRYTLRKRKIRLRSVVKEFEPWFSNLPLRVPGGQHVLANISVRIEGDPVVYADPLHMRRAIFNVLNDAIVHSNGEPVRISVRAKKNIVFSTTNVGRKIENKALRLIGDRPYTTQAVGVLHGYGKVAAKRIMKAHGGKFTKRNAPQGFRISLAIPRRAA